MCWAANLSRAAKQHPTHCLLPGRLPVHPPPNIWIEVGSASQGVCTWRSMQWPVFGTRIHARVWIVTTCDNQLCCLRYADSHIYTCPKITFPKELFRLPFRALPKSNTCLIQWLVYHSSIFLMYITFILTLSHFFRCPLVREATPKKRKHLDTRIRKMNMGWVF